MRFGKFNTNLVRARQHRCGFAVCAVVWATSLVSFCTVSADELLRAVRTGDLGKVKLLVKEQPDLVNRKVDGNPPLYWAVVDHHIDVVKWLLENGADVNQRAGQGLRTPIFEARTAEMAKLLIEHGANLKATGQWSVTPLREAVRGKRMGVVKVILEAGEKLDFDAAVELGDNKLVAEMLAEKPWLAKPPRKPLHDAANDGNLELVKLLLDHGADPDLDYGFRNVSGPYTPVTNAVTRGHYEIAELLLQHGASPNVSGGRNHDNLFLFAIAYLDAKFTQLMLDHGADLVTGDQWGRNITPLHVAAALGGASGVSRFRPVGQPESLQGNESQALEKVRYLVQAGADVTARTADGSTPLLSAALAGHQQVCELLLKQGAELDIGSACLLGNREVVERLIIALPELRNQTDLPLRQPALHWAARAGDIEIVKLLLRHGAKVDARAPELEYQDAGGFSVGMYRNSPGPTALHMAARMGHGEVVRALLDHGADINSKAGENSYFQSAIEMACYGEHWSTVRLLLDRDAQVRLSANLLSGITDAELIARLLAAGDIDLKGPDGTRLLAASVANKNNQAAVLLIAGGTELDIFSACILGRADDVRRLIETTPALTNAVQTDYPRETPLALAVQNGHAAIVRLLIAKGAPLPATDTGRASLIHQAAEYGHLEVLQLLVKNGFSLDAQDEAGSSLLHAASFGSQPEIARYLISSGADVNARNFRRATPFHVLGGGSAEWVGDDKNADEHRRRTMAVARILLDAGAEVNVKDAFDRTPLHRAASHGVAGVAELLLTRGAEVNARDYRNTTPLGVVGRSFGKISFDHKLEPVEKLLREHGGVE